MAGKTRTLLTRLVALAGAVFWSPVSVLATEVQRIDAAEAKKLVDKGEAVLIDVRARAAWDMGHVQGALHMPGDEIAARLSELPKNKLIITYCT
jgi:predicted sulfurtransferase